MKKSILIVLLTALLLALAPAHGQDVSGDRLVVNLSDPSRPGLLKVSLFNGGITVKGYAGKEVIVEGANRNRRGPAVTPDGLRRIDTNPAGLGIEEENNVVTISNNSP